MHIVEDVANTDETFPNVVLTVAALLMAALTALAVLAAPLVFRVYSLNVADDVGGPARILWHNESLSSEGMWRGWAPVYPNVLKVLSTQGREGLPLD